MKRNSSILAVFALLLLAVTASAQNWLRSQWMYRKPITVPAAQIGSDLTDFPLLVSLTNDTDLAAHAREDGADVFFTAEDGTTILDHEIESWSNGTLVAWVRVPLVSSAADTRIHMVYGNPAASGLDNPTGVWNADYMAVWHLDEHPANGTPGHLDSTTNGHAATPAAFNGTPASTTAAAGKIDGADALDGTDDVLTVPDAPSLDTTVATVSAWIYPTAAKENTILDKSTSSFGGGLHLQLLADNRARFWSGLNTSGRQADTADTISLNQWTHLAGRDDGTRLKIFVNGVEKADAPSGGVLNNNAALTIGNSAALSGNFFFAGKLDEVRVSRSARGTAWIAASHANQADPELFAAAGAEEEGPYSFGVWGYRKRLTLQAPPAAGTLTDFPLLVSLTNDTDLAARGASDGGDIVFTASDGSARLPHEIDAYTNGTLQAWVRVPLLPSATNVTAYLYYGLANAGRQEQPEAVWAEDCKAVWHMGEPNAMLRDATTNGHHASAVSGLPAGAAGLIGLANDFIDAQSDYVTIPASSDFSFSGACTISAWIHNRSNNGYEGILGTYTPGWILALNGNMPANTLQCYNNGTWRGSVTVPVDTWVHMVLVYESGIPTASTDGRLYLNGVQTGASFDITDQAAGGNLTIGAGGPSWTANRFEGLIDEVRISTAAQASNRVWASWATVADPESFYQLGEEEDPVFVDVTLDTVPPGLSVTADGADVTAPAILEWTSNSVHAIGAPSPQTNGASRFFFDSWSDGGAQTHDIVVTGADAFTARFSTQHLWTAVIDPPEAGAVVPPTGWFDQGDSFTPVPVRNPGYGFVEWSGDLTGSATNQPVVMDSSSVVTARFEITGTQITIDSSPAGRDLLVDGVSTTGGTYVWEAGSVHTVAVAVVTQFVGNTRYTWRSWSDGGGTEHAVTASESVMHVTADFLAEHLWTWSAWPSQGGDVAAPASGSWLTAGTSFTAQASASAGFLFGRWTGDLTGASASLPVTMNAPIDVTALFQKPPAPGVTYVKHDAPGANNGTSWIHAYRELQNALTAAGDGDNIWVAQGFYYPGAAGDRAATFQLKSGVAIYGGFQGYEGALTERNPSLYTTALSGDIDRDGLAASNSYHVVTGADNARLDGVTVRDGYANGAADLDGAGVYNNNVAPTLANCTFTANVASRSGGAMQNYSAGADPLISNCVFRGNSATVGGCISDWTGVPLIYGSTFTSNTATHGGALHHGNHLPSDTYTVLNSSFTDNAVSGSGGAVWGGNWKGLVSNCVFRGNSALNAGAWGGTMGGQPLDIANSRFVRNRATGGNGGALHFDKPGGAWQDCEFIGNSASGSGGALYHYNSGTPTVRRCTFAANTAAATGYGGGVAYQTASSAYEDCVFSGNRSAGYAGVVYANSSGPSLQRCVFAGNESAVHGGALWHNNGGGTSLRVRTENCVFAGNAAGGSGGALGAPNAYVSGHIVHNSTFSDNTASASGGAVLTGDNTLEIFNSVLWENTAGSAGNQVHEQTAGKTTVFFSDVAGGWTGSGAGNINADPLFEGGPSGIWTSVGAYDADTGQTILTDVNAAWASDALRGRIIQPDTNQVLQLCIASNSTHTVFVWGDATSDRAGQPVAQVGSPYRVHFYQQKPGSPLIGAGEDFGVTNDIRQVARPQPAGGTFDIGPYEGAIEHSVSFATASSLVSELGPDVVLAVSLSSFLHDRTGTVQYAATGGSAVNGTDFNLAPGSLTFDTANMVYEIPVEILDNPNPDGVRTAEISLLNPTNITLGAIAMHTITIIDDDQPPEVSFDSASGSGPESVTPLHIGVSLDHVHGLPVTVNYGSTGGNAGNGSDYELPNGTLTFAVGETAKSIEVTIYDNPPPEGTETFTVALTDPVHATLGAIVEYTYTIFDDDLRYVDASAAGANNGTSWADAFTSLAAALGAADGGDAIWVAGGTYAGPFTIPADVALYGGFASGMGSLAQRDPVENVTTLNAGAPVVTGADGATLDGFKVTGGNGTSGGGLYVSGGSMTVARCEFRGNFASVGGAGVCLVNSGSLVERCLFVNNGTTAGSGGGGLYVSGTPPPTIRNCVFTGNTTAAYDGAGIYISYSPSAQIVNCTIVGNTAKRQGGGIEVYDAGIHDPVILKNCILWDNHTQQMDDLGGNEICVQNDGRIEMSYCDVEFDANWLYERGGGQLVQLAGNMAVDPMFVDQPGGDFTLQQDSPCIDTGTESGAATNDFTGALRPAGEGYDIGAYEYGGVYFHRQPEAMMILLR